jgi:uncharacterized membrane protein
MMSLINPVLLYGLALAVIPVLLHFLLKAKPKKMLFPALSLLLNRQKSTTRRLRIRHFWLLLFRILVIALIVLALSRPSLPAIDYSPGISEIFITAIILILMFAIYWGFSRKWNHQNLAEQVISRKKNRLQFSVVLSGLLLLLLLVGWPYQKRIRAELSKPHPDMALNIPVAAVFIFDNSLSMDYRLQNETRLDLCKNIAGKQVGKLPAGSRLAIADLSSNESILFQGDLSTAQSRIDTLELSPFSVPINKRLQAALKLQEEDYRRISSIKTKRTESKQKTVSDRFSREIYLFTDLCKSAWNDKTVELLKKDLERLDQIQLYIIDAGVDETGNYAIKNIHLSSNTVSPNGHLTVYSEVASTGNLKGPVQVELFLTDKDGQTVKRGEQSVSFETGHSIELQFPLSQINPPVTQGIIKLVSGDPYSHDDTRNFTVAVKESPRVLVVADKQESSIYWKNALAPQELIEAGKARYQVEFMTTNQLETADLKNYQAIYLVKSSAPTLETWQSLREYVQGGGGLGIFLGSRNGSRALTALSYNSEAAQKLIPGKLLADLNFDPESLLDFSLTEHPAINFFRINTTGELTTSQFRHFWLVEPHENGEVLISYTNDRQSPYLISRQYQNGRVILLTSASDLAEDWNDLPRSSWYVVLADQLTNYLCASKNSQFNYLPGQPVSIRINQESNGNRYLLRTPEQQQLPIKKDPKESFIFLEKLINPGQYTLFGSENSQLVLYGFSINNRIEESDFSRLDEEELDEFLGKERYHLARKDLELERAVSNLRMGKEMYSVILMIMIFFFCSEHFMANWFYGNPANQLEATDS